jgi:hypothetical protein
MRERTTTLQSPNVSLETSAGNSCFACQRPSRPAKALSEVESAASHLCVRGLRARSARDCSGGLVRPLLPGRARSRAEKGGTTVCKCLQAWEACRVPRGGVVLESEYFRLTPFGFNKMRVGRNFASGAVLAHRLRPNCPNAHVHYPTERRQIAGIGRTPSSFTGRRQVPRGRARDRHPQYVHDGSRRRNGFLGIPGPEHIPPGRIRPGRSCVTGARGKSL